MQNIRFSPATMDVNSGHPYLGDTKFKHGLAWSCKPSDWLSGCLAVPSDKHTAKQQLIIMGKTHILHITCVNHPISAF